MMTLGGLGDSRPSTPSPSKLAPVSTGVGVIPRVARHISSTVENIMKTLITSSSCPSSPCPPSGLRFAAAQVMIV